MQLTSPSSGVRFEALARLWAKATNHWTDISAAALILGIAGTAAHIGAVHTMLYGHDIFLALDAGWRVLNGQRPDVDFSPSLSPALGMLFAVALRLAHNSVNAVGYASALVGAAAGLLSYWLVRRRLPGMPAVLAAIVLTLIAVAPFPVGLPPNSLSQAMLYNRYGYALLGLVLLEAFQGSRDGRRADAAGGGFLTGVVIIALLFLKPSYCLVAVAFVICSSVLARHDARRYLGILLGLLACGIAMMAYLRLDFAAVWKDLHLMSQARSAGLSMWTIRWSLINAVTDFLPLAVLAVLIKSWKTIAISMVVFTGGALLLATNGQLRGFPLNAVLAILLIERGRAALKTDAVPILIGLIAYLPFCFGSAGGLGYALFQSRRIPPHSEVARFQPPHLAGLLLYDMPDGTDADRRSNGPTYVTYVNDGVNLLNRASRMDETVFTLDVQNPFSYALLRRPAHGGSAALYFDHTFNDQHKPSAAWLFGSADIVMVPKHPSGAELDASALFRNYLGDVKSGFRLCEETEWWRLYKRPWNLAGCEANARSSSDAADPLR